MIAELATTWQQIIIRAAIVAGLSFALVLLAGIGGIAWVVHWFTDRRHIHELAEERTEVLEYDEAA